MSGLMSLWWVSIGLAAAAIVWISALVVGRLFREKRDARRERDRQQARNAFLDVMNGSGDALSRLHGVDHRVRLMGETLLEALAMVRGAERERLTSALLSTGLAERLQRRLSLGGIAGRMVAAEALSHFPGPTTVAALRNALVKTRNSNFRVALMRSLIDLDEAPPLSQVLHDIHRSRGADSLLYLPLVGQLVKADTGAALAAFGAPETPARARVALAEALGACGDFRAVEPLCIATGAPEVELRISSVRGLGALGHPAAELRILKALGDPVWMVRAAACEAAGRIGLTSAVPLLIGQLSDAVWWVRLRAGEALLALGPAGVDGLQAAASGQGDASRRAASLALAERGLALAAP